MFGKKIRFLIDIFSLTENPRTLKSALEGREHPPASIGFDIGAIEIGLGSKIGQNREKPLKNFGNFTFSKLRKSPRRKISGKFYMVGKRIHLRKNLKKFGKSRIYVF